MPENLQRDWVKGGAWMNLCEVYHIQAKSSVFDIVHDPFQALVKSIKRGWI